MCLFLANPVEVERFAHCCKFPKRRIYSIRQLSCPVLLEKSEQPVFMWMKAVLILKSSKPL